MTVEGVQITDPRWIGFVLNNAVVTALHHHAWAQMLAECYGYRALALTLTDDGGQIIAGLPIMEVRGLFGGRR